MRTASFIAFLIPTLVLGRWVARSRARAPRTADKPPISNFDRNLPVTSRSRRRASFTPSSRLLFSPDIPHSSNNALQPVGDVTSSYDGDSVCVVSEHGSLSAGCGQRVFQRAAVDTRRAHAAAHHPLA